MLVGAIVGCGLARVWLVLVVAHLDASPAAAAAAFAALGVFGLLPLAPSAPPAALLLVGGGAGAGALAAGLALSATSIAAVLVYAGALALTAGLASGAPGDVRRVGSDAAWMLRRAGEGHSYWWSGCPSPVRRSAARRAPTR